MAEHPKAPARLRVMGRDVDPTLTRVTLGRSEAADVQVDAPLVSRAHGVFEPSATGWQYRDVGSQNGSYVDGRRVDRIDLGRSTELRLGAPDGPAVAVEVLGPASAAAPAPPERGATSLGRLSTVHEVAASVISIGRDQSNDLVVDDLRASRRHARLTRGTDGSTSIEDLRSQNGTFVDGVRISRVALPDGSLVGIGGVTFRYASGRLEQYQDQGAAWLAAIGLTVTLDGGRRLLDEVSFALEPSSMLGVVGPSGAGKTTLMNALTGFKPADGGNVMFAGRDLYAAYDEFRQRMGFVPQFDALHPQLTVRQALSYAAELRFPSDVGPASRQMRVEEVMEELGLTDRADLRIARLSGGQRKRTSVAVELLTRPSLLFLDEPTSGLDPANESNLMDLLHDLARGGRTVVVVTHSLQGLDRYDRLLYMAPGGRTAFFGPPADVAPYFERQGVDPAPERIFRALEEQADLDWKGSFEADPIHERYVRQPLADAGPGGAFAITPSVPPAPTPWIRQLSVLTRRYLSVIRADRAVLALLAVQAPVFGLLYLLLFRTNVLSTLYAIEAAVLVWLLALGATWLGTTNAIREIVKELPVYLRERAIGLSISAYLSSKLLVLGVITVIQTIVMTVIAMVPQSLPPQSEPGYDRLLVDLGPGLGPQIPTTSFDGRGAVLADPFAELLVVVALTGLAGMSVALLVSAIVRSTDRAATVLPLLLITQTVVSAPMLGAPPPGVREVGYLSTTQWGFAAMASTVDLNTVRAPFLEVQSYLRADANDTLYEPGAGDRPSWRHDADVWRTNILLLVALSAVSIIGAWWALRQMDPGRGGARRGRAPPGS